MECCLRLVVVRNVETCLQISSSCIAWFASDQVYFDGHCGNTEIFMLTKLLYLCVLESEEV